MPCALLEVSLISFSAFQWIQVDNPFDGTKWIFPQFFVIIKLDKFEIIDYLINFGVEALMVFHK